MPKKTPDDVRLFRLVAEQRFEEASFLSKESKGVYAQGSVYLAGYAVECILKALWLSRTPPSQRTAVINEFRGANAHDFDWLKRRYLESGGERFPPEIARAFRGVNTWQTHLRYKPGKMRFADAKLFLEAAERILAWGNRRF